MDCHLQSCPSVCYPAAATFPRLEVLLAFGNSRSFLNPNGWSIFPSVQDPFWIRNEFQFLSYYSATDLGSAYGNQPYRSFREQTLPSPCARNRAQRQHVCQHTRQHIVASQHLHSRVLLWRRPGWWRVFALRFIQHYSQYFIPGLLRRRPGRRRIPAICSGQQTLQHRTRGRDARTIVLRGRPWWRGITACCRVAASNVNLHTLTAAGRLSIRRGGQ